VVSILVTLLVYWLAEEYAELLGEQLEGGQLPTWVDVRTALSARTSSPGERGARFRRSRRPPRPTLRGHGGVIRCQLWRCGARAGGDGVNVTLGLDLLGGEGALAADVAGEGQPPGEQSAEAVAVARQGGDVDDQPEAPAQETADVQWAG
jgi:hypothetical protein